MTTLSRPTYRRDGLRAGIVHFGVGNFHCSHQAMYIDRLLELEAAQADEPKPDEAAQREIAECDAKLRQHHAALEAGADPVLVTSWMNETQAKRAATEARLRRPAGRRRLTRDEITSLVKALGDLIQVLKAADPADRAEIYSQLGLMLTYHPKEKRVVAEARPASIVYVGACVSEDRVATYVHQPGCLDR